MVVQDSLKVKVKPGDLVPVSSTPYFMCEVVSVCRRDGTILVKPCDAVEFTARKDDDPDGWGGWNVI